MGITILKGLEVDENPMQKALLQSAAQELETVYEDEWLLVVNKPAGMLSVPGKEEAVSVYSVMRRRYPEADGPLIVHRLDMATSGLLVIAKTKQVHQNLQAQFRDRSVSKRYIALLQGIVSPDTGTVELPLCLNPLDRPRQMVHTEHGKPAVTDFEVLERKDNHTRIAFYPSAPDAPISSVCMPPILSDCTAPLSAMSSTERKPNGCICMPRLWNSRIP